jgi:proline iminopeptidase
MLTPPRRHHDHEQNTDDTTEETNVMDEESPLLYRHMSMEKLRQFTANRKSYFLPLLLALLVVVAVLVASFFPIIAPPRYSDVPVPIEQAQEHILDIGKGLSIWYRTWGNRGGGIPVLFVHGGPGNDVDDYYNRNKRFFDISAFFVVEVDQRGTGHSQPSVRDDWRNMKYYVDIDIEKMSADFELVRRSLKIDRWLVWGGSWGSTLTLDYGMRYPRRCIALIVRGIYLNTRIELDAVYSRKAHEHSPEELKAFDAWFELAANEASRSGEAELDPNGTAGRVFQMYERMIQRGDRDAIWQWMVFENNLMEEVPSDLLDPDRIDEALMPMAQSVSFFEARLYYHGTFEVPVRLLERVKNLKGVHTWICQGSRDKVCPPRYAHELVGALEANDCSYTARFIEAAHEDTDPVMEQCLKDSLHDFLKNFS